jgi:dipeptidyl aminopeptidase/acylaminoacyl peptidase
MTLHNREITRPAAFILLILVIPLLASAQDSKSLLEIDDYFDLKMIGSPVVSPEGEWIAYSMETTDLEEDKSETRIWMVSADGGEPLPMTAKGYSAGDPQWSPDGKYLSFTASRDEGDQTQVWVLDRRGGEARQLTDIEQGVSGYQWSPDGSRLLLLIRDKKENETEEDDPDPYVIDRLQFKRDYAGYLDRRRTHIYTYTPGDTAAVQITFGDYDDSSPRWSPDGTRIAFSSNRTENPDGNFNTDIWVVDANRGQEAFGLIQVTKNPGPDYSPSWSPSGDEITYVSSIEPEKIWYATSHLAIASADGSGSERVLTRSLDRNVSSPVFTEDEDRIRFILEDAGESQLASVQTDGSDLRREVQGNLSVGSYHQAGSHTTLSIARFSSPSDIYYYHDGDLQKLTSANSEWLDAHLMPGMEEIRFNSADGTPIHGFLVKPVGYSEGERVPTILWIHGGPVAQFEHSFRFEPHLFASNGYAVLMVNPRGSSGYGQAFSEVLFADWGNKDFEDVMAAVDYAIERGIADPERLGVGGWSYGGILTNYVITQTDRFAGAISGASETLYRSNYGHDHYQLHWEMELGLPWETPEKWERISPFNDVANITTPTLWIGGAEDWNVPILGSEQMYQAMKRLGRETLLVVYPGEHHGISRPVFQQDRFERYLHWFGKYVKEEE